MDVTLDLNCDLGEGVDAWEPGVVGLDQELLGVVTSANLACGGHAGDERTMVCVARAAAARGVALGAHVSYVDREHFGRRFLDVPPDELRAQVAAQLELVSGAAAAQGARITYVKPHGALYNAIVHHEEHAAAVLDAMDSASVGSLPVVGLPGSAVLAEARRRGFRGVAEAFADRGYRADGTLVPRGQDGDLLIDERAVAERVVRIATERRVRAVDGSDVALDVETVCVHSDTPGAVALARQVRAELASAGVTVVPFAGLP
ncbi:LamB/YcsF family protein [Cellulomonas sp. DKR-3]|uniref:LamB/YcsF family protein n=1 Tax=Cellulomonas fulva TaxID=2835530 RepID=A0ABS5TYC6_9CELL|nr:5-oxoprolinase subunit PxpA [Cellulomonas fulva]MBT0994157.1 LamB/YcsF family protein [Cellulomonas fulva]